MRWSVFGTSLRVANMLVFELLTKHFFSRMCYQHHYLCKIFNDYITYSLKYIVVKFQGFIEGKSNKIK